MSKGGVEGRGQGIEYGAPDLVFVCARSIFVDKTLEISLVVEAQPLHGRLRPVAGH
jgi:hypothetical protein